MKTIYRIALCLILVSIVTVSFAQSRSETKAYNKAVKKSTLKLYDKFLTKYPESVYLQTIMFKRDSILFYQLDTTTIKAYEGFIESYPNSQFVANADSIIDLMNTSQLTKQEVACAISQNLNEELKNKHHCAVSLKIDNVEHIFCLSLDSKFRENRDLILYSLKADGQEWKVDTALFQEVYFQRGSHNMLRLTDSLSIVELKGNRYLHFDYELSSDKKDYVEYVGNLVDIKHNSLYSAMFAGRKFGDIIEGESMDGAQVYGTTEMGYLLSSLNTMPNLKRISKECLLADQAIEWWYTENANARSSIKFGLLPEDNLLVKEFKKSKYVEYSQRNNVAIMDVRGYTVLCAYNKSSKEYSLVWCEALPKDKKKDKILNSIYFENSNSLVLYYYQGRRTFKVRVNLATKRVTY